jgi:XTP/dITP diphosphohydrolase
MKLVFATNNLNKLKEVQSLLPPEIELLSLKDIDCLVNIPETQPTISGNAIQKALFVQSNFGYDCFADDTGLEVAALNGAPGVYSARYAGTHCNATDNMDKLLDELSKLENRKAQFKTVIALHLDEQLYTFNGICKGEITLTKAGNKGFGYDPIFTPDGFEQTFAEMDVDLKNKIGHRGKAVQQLIKFLISNGTI